MATLSNTIHNDWACMSSRLSAPIATMASTIASDTVQRAFTATILLAGGVRQAEAAMLDAIRELGPGPASEETLLVACSRTAAANGPGPEAGVAGADGTSHLPPELQRILRLPAHLRHSFVLRFMVGLSKEQCLRMNLRNIDQDASTAARQLAGVREPGQSL